MSTEISILFDSYYLYHLPQFEPLIKLLSIDTRFSIYHSTSKEISKQEFELCKTILKKKQGTFIEAENETERQKKIRGLNLNVFICGWSRYDISKYVTPKTLVVMIYHGIGIKPSYWLDNHERIDLRMVEGPYRIEQLRNYGVKTDLALTGFIKLDPLFQNIVEKTDLIKKNYNFDKNKKTILFAPTFYPSSVEPIGMRLGEYTKGYNVLIKPHLWTTFLNKFAELNHEPKRKIFKNLEKTYEHIHLIPPENYNIIPFYKLSDLLLTEASSTIYEMLACNKPVIVNRFFKLKLSHRIFKQRLYKKRLNHEMENDITNFCYEAKTPKELSNVFTDAFNDSKLKMPNIKEHQEKMLYKLDGLASERAKKEILNRL